MTANIEETRELLTGIARLMLGSSAEGVFEVRKTIRRVGSDYGVDADVLLLPDQILLTVDGTSRVVAVPPSMPLDQMERADALLREEAPRLSVTDARRALSGILESAHPYAWWVRIIGVVLFAVGFAPSVIPTVSEVGVSAVLGLVMGVLYVVAAGRTAELLLPLIGSFVVGVVTLTLFAETAAHVGPVALMVPALFVVIPGDYLSAAAAELITGNITAGATRLVWSMFLLAQLVIGVVMATEVTGTGSRELFDGPQTGSLPFWVIVVAWIPFTIGLALVFGARLGSIPWMAALTIGTYLIFATLLSLAGELFATLAASMALGVAATVVARLPGRPPQLVLIIGGFFALTVGSQGLRGMTALIGGHVVDGTRDLMDFALLMPTVAFGIVAGMLLARREPGRAVPI